MTEDYEPADINYEEFEEDDSCNSDWESVAESDESFDSEFEDDYVPEYNKGLYGVDSSGINAILQKTDRILAKDEKIIVTTVTGDTLGCANHKEGIIYLGYDAIKKLKTIDSFYKTMIVVKGLNYHELQHLELTDYSEHMIHRFLTKKHQESKTSLTARWVSIGEYFPHLNLLEDCRIENLATLRFPRMKYYFTFCAMHIISKEFSEGFKTSSKSAVAQNYLVLYGRKFLYEDAFFRKSLKTIRERFCKEFAEDVEVLEEGEKIVDEFIKTASPHTRLELAFKLYELFNKKNMRMNISSSDVGNLKAKKGSKSMNEQLSSQIQIVIKEANEKLKNEPADSDDKKEEKEDGGSTGKNKKKNGKNKDCDKNKSQKSQDSNSDNSDNSGQGGESEEEGNSDFLSEDQVQEIQRDIKHTERLQKEGKLTKEQCDKQVEKLLKQLGEAIEEHSKAKEVAKIFDKVFKNLSEKIENNENVKKELMQEIVKLQGGTGSGGNDRYLRQNKELIITEKLKNESGKVEKVLRILRGDLHMRLNKYRNKGKVDISSVVKSRHNGTLRYFKEKQMNKVGKSKLGVSLIIDSSGSIDDRDFLNEIEAVWCLSDSLEKINNHVQVIEFSNNFRILKPFDKKGDWKRTMSGGTNTTTAMEQAMKDLLNLKKAKKIHNLFVILITDGLNDGGHYRFKPVVDKLHKAGIKVLWIFASKGLQHDRYDDCKKNAEIVDWFIEVPDVQDLSKNLQKIVIDVQKKINNNIGRVK